MNHLRMDQLQHVAEAIAELADAPLKSEQFRVPRGGVFKGHLGGKGNGGKPAEEDLFRLVLQQLVHL